MTPCAVSTWDGILLVDKEEGITSYDVIRKVKACLCRLGVKKIGHAGTLDPFATGLLIVLLGQGTKLSRFLMSQPKTYRGTMRRGESTDTLDLTGKVLERLPVPPLGLDEIQEKARGFLGEIEQIPPAYSAVKHQGERAYKLARKGVAMSLEMRRVRVYSLQVLSVEGPDISLEVGCSGGTYMRTLAADLGRALGTVAHLRSLRRMAIGAFHVMDGASSREILGESGEEPLLNRMIPLSAAISHLPSVSVDPPLAERIRHGYQPLMEELHGDPEALVLGRGHWGQGDCLFRLVKEGGLVAIASLRQNALEGYRRLSIDRVFY